MTHGLDSNVRRQRRRTSSHASGTSAAAHTDQCGNATIRSTLDALSGAAAAKPVHSADFSIDPKLVAKGLSQVGLLDVMGSTELAALCGVSTT